MDTERTAAIVIGGGQAGLATSYYLAQDGVRHIVLEAAPRIGQSWRSRWDSLRLFTPARFDGLPGMPFPTGDGEFPAKDEMAPISTPMPAGFTCPFGRAAESTC